MPVALQNITTNLIELITRDYITVQYPFAIEVKDFASYYIFQKFKITKVVATVVNISTTSTSFSVVTPSTTITVTIQGGESVSNIWTGEVIIESGNVITFKSNASGTGSYLTMVVEGQYQ